jgi:6-phosphofructokinase
VLAKDSPVICCFVSDDVNSRVLEQLNDSGTKLITLRATSFNNVDLEAASRLGVAAVQALLDGKGGYMVGEINREIAYTPLQDTWEKKKPLHTGLTALLDILSD